jgi:hypothetical protein
VDYESKTSNIIQALSEALDNVLKVFSLLVKSLEDKHEEIVFASKRDLLKLLEKITELSTRLNGIDYNPDPLDSTYGLGALSLSLIDIGNEVKKEIFQK